MTQTDFSHHVRPHSFSPAEKSQFLRFVGGITRLPHNMAHLPHRFEIHHLDGSAAQLPVSATCFFTLKLPAYTSQEQLRSKLLVAMTHCAAIDTDGDGGAFELLPEDGGTAL